MNLKETLNVECSKAITVATFWYKKGLLIITEHLNAIQIIIKIIINVADKSKQ